MQALRVRAAPGRLLHEGSCSEAGREPGVNGGLECSRVNAVARPRSRGFGRTHEGACNGASDGVEPLRHGPKQAASVGVARTNGIDRLDLAGGHKGFLALLPDGASMSAVRAEDRSRKPGEAGGRKAGSLLKHEGLIVGEGDGGGCLRQGEQFVA